MTPNTAAEALLYSTVKLVTSKAGVPTGSGTGFFYRVNLGAGRLSVVLITNKHVVAGADQVVAVCHLHGEVINGRPGPSGELADCVIDLQDGGAVMHPDPTVDLCAVPINGCLQNAMAQGRPVFFMAMTKDDIPGPEDWSNFDAIEEVTMIGCPRGLFDEVNNLPLVRRGITATPLSVKYNGKNEFMVDMACFPGSSGSPVVVYDRNGYLDRKNKHISARKTEGFHLSGYSILVL